MRARADAELYSAQQEAKANEVSIHNGPVHKGENHIPKAVSNRDSDPFLIWKPDFTLCEHKALSNQAFEMRK